MTNLPCDPGSNPCGKNKNYEDPGSQPGSGQTQHLQSNTWRISDKIKSDDSDRKWFWILILSKKRRSPPLCRSKKKSKSDPSVVGRWSKFSFLPTVRQLSIALHLASMIRLVDWKLPDSRRLLNRIDLRSNNKRKPKSRPKGDDEFMDSQSNIIAISSWKKNTKRIKRQGGKREKKKKREFVK